MIKNLLKEAFELKSKGYYRHAIETFYKALAIDNNSYELILEIANLYYLLKKEEHALTYIEQALKLNPIHIPSLTLLKKIFIDKKAWDKAEQTANNIYKISENENHLAEVLNLLNKQNKYNEVLSYEKETSNPNLLYELAYAKLFTNQAEGGLEYINKALEIENDDKFLFLKSNLLFKLDRNEECKEILKNINTLEDDAEFLNFVGLVEQYDGNYDSAIQKFMNAINITPNNDVYYYNCASTYFKMNKIDEAKKFYNLAISINPENQSYHFALANLYYSEKHYKRAMEELNYDFFEANLLKSIILYDTGYLAIARKEITKLAEERPNDPLVIQYKNKIEDELKI